MSSSFRQYATANVAIAETLGPVGTALRRHGWQLVELRLHLAAASAAEDLTVTLDSAAGAMYDVVLLTAAMNALADYHWLPVRPIVLDPGDVLNIAFPNTNTDVYGLELIWQGGG